MKLTSTVKIELRWWDKHLTCSQHIFTEFPKLTIFSDACPTGWDAACKENSTGENWTSEESCFHIITLEMAAALYALKIYTRDVSNCQIQLKVDNTSSLTWINKKTLPNEAIFLIVKELWEYCIGKNLGISTSYINKNKNKVADKESSKLRNYLEWSLQAPIIDKIRLVYVPVTIDLFPSRINAGVGHFYSYTPGPEACGHDVFSYSW